MKFTLLGMTNTQVVHAIRQNKPPELPTWPPALVNLIEMCIASAPSLRPSFQDISFYLSSDDETLFPEAPKPKEEVIPNVVEDIDRFVRESSKQLEQQAAVHFFFPRSFI